MIISIVVPFYKGNQYIPQILKQYQLNKLNLEKSYPNIQLELILVNDSPEEKIAIELTEDIKIVNNANNVGIHQSRINGLKQVSGEYVLLLDQDDRISEHYIESQYSHLNNSDIVVSNALEEKGNQEFQFYQSNKHQNCVKTLKWYLSVSNQIISPGQCLIKVDKIPLFWQQHSLKINGADDMLLWIEMLLEGKDFSINEELLYTHVDTGKNVSSDLSLMTASKKAVYDILTKANKLNYKQQKRLKRCIQWKQYLYAKHSKIAKCLYSIGYIDLVLINIYYQLIKRKII